ncbi:Uncharacterized protein TCAP_01194 [Tolypocladium capitatum]|uniref:Uncharacterized protein n=1 Tax=Tolypocladium capitatum TaxID=45235 RepID=A0A2K3QMX7_9HYPO|nr:Uncharacterized protein TCAP_01194 [Tolypocladium capitatum]
MVRSLALLAALAAAAAAAAAADGTTTVSLLLPQSDAQKLVGSVVRVDATVTTFVIGCPPGTPAESCGVPSSQTVVQGPSTWDMPVSLSAPDTGAYTQDSNCKLDPSRDVASCHISVSNSQMVSEAATVVTGYSSMLIPVTITAGVNKLSGKANAAGPMVTQNAALAAVAAAAGGAMLWA